MPTLRDIAKQIGGLAVAKAPKKTGRLKRAWQKLILLLMY